MSPLTFRNTSRRRRRVEKKEEEPEVPEDFGNTVFIPVARQSGIQQSKPHSSERAARQIREFTRGTLGNVAVKLDEKPSDVEPHIFGPMLKGGLANDVHMQWPDALETGNPRRCRQLDDLAQAPPGQGIKLEPCAVVIFRSLIDKPYLVSIWPDNSACHCATLVPSL